MKKLITICLVLMCILTICVSCGGKKHITKKFDTTALGMKVSLMYDCYKEKPNEETDEVASASEFAEMDLISDDPKFADKVNKFFSESIEKYPYIIERIVFEDKDLDDMNYSTLYCK